MERNGQGSQGSSGGAIALPTLNSFLQFLENRCVALENVEVDNYKGLSTGTKDKQDSHSKHSFHLQDQGGSKNVLLKCFKFNGLNILKKRQLVEISRLSYNCLEDNHGVSQCLSKGCRVCKRKHNTLLHQDGNIMVNNNQKMAHGSTQIRDKDRDNRTPINNGVQEATQGTFLGVSETEYTGVSHGRDMGISRENEQQISLILGGATAQINLVMNDGSKIQARALLDSG